MRHAEERHARSHQGCQLGTDWTGAEERPVDREQSFRLQKEIPTKSIVAAEHLGQSINGVEEGLKFCGEPRSFRDRFERGGAGDLDRTAVVPAKDALAVSAQRVLALAVEQGTAIYERVAGLWPAVTAAAGSGPYKPSFSAKKPTTVAVIPGATNSGPSWPAPAMST
jgi:hypothetical protein